MRHPTLVLMLALSTLLLGCEPPTPGQVAKVGSVAVDGLMVSADAKVLRDRYPVVRDLIEAHLDRLGPDDAGTVHAAGAALDTLHTEMQPSGGGVAEALTLPEAILRGYRTARPLYRLAREALQRHRAEFAAADWQTLADFHRLAMDLDARLQRNLNDPAAGAYAGMAGDALTLVGTLAAAFSPPPAGHGR